MKVLVFSYGKIDRDAVITNCFQLDQSKALKKDGVDVAILLMDFRNIWTKKKWGIIKDFNENIPVYGISIPSGILPPVLFKTASKIKNLFGRKNKIISIESGTTPLVNIFPFLLSLQKYFVSKAIEILFVKILKDFGRPNLIHAHFTIQGAIAIDIKKKYGIPLVFTEHNSYINMPKLSKKDKFWGDIVYPNADRVVAVSTSLAHRIKYHFNVDAVVIPNIVDTDSFSVCQYIRSIANTNEKDNIFSFISIGNLEYRKGFDLLIKAFHLANFPKKVKLLIIGEGNLKEELSSQIINLNLSDQVNIHNRLPARKDLYEKLLSSDCFVLASRLENFGVVCIEAMLAGLPVIATNCEGPKDIINDENGLLIPCENATALKEAMQYMFDFAKNYDSQKISEYCMQNFSPEIVARKIENIFREVLVCKNY